MDYKKIGLLGGRGYVGQEIIELLNNHKYLNISSVFSSSKAGQSLHINTGKDLLYQDLSIDKIDFNVNVQLEKKFIKAIEKYWPEINSRKLIPDYSGIRTSIKNKDFVIQGKEIHKMRGIINLFGIESPGLTSSLAIGKYIFDKYLNN